MSISDWCLEEEAQCLLVFRRKSRKNCALKHGHEANSRAGFRFKQRRYKVRARGLGSRVRERTSVPDENRLASDATGRGSGREKRRIMEPVRD